MSRTSRVSTVSTVVHGMNSVARGPSARAETRTEEGRRKRDELLLALLLLLLADTREAVDGHVEDLLAGRMTPEQFGAAMLGTLVGAHGHAAYLGRNKAGLRQAFGAGDALFGKLAAQEQAEYLDGFVRDVAGGRYTADDGGLEGGQVRARAQLYPNALWGTANDAWRVSLAPDTVVHWDLGDAEQHCDDGVYGSCPELAAASPYTAGTLPTVPGRGDTACHGNCTCGLRTEDGFTSFRREPNTRRWEEAELARYPGQPRRHGKFAEGKMAGAASEPDAAQSAADHVRWKPANQAENIAHGEAAVAQVIDDQTDVRDAMYRQVPGSGADWYIHFPWGVPGDASQDFAGGYGFAHIVAKHGREAAEMVPTVIAHGRAFHARPGRRGGPDRTEMRYGKRRVFLEEVPVPDGAAYETWVVTGYGPAKPRKGA